MEQADASSIHSEPMIELLRELALDLGAVWNRYTDDVRHFPAITLKFDRLDSLLTIFAPGPDCITGSFANDRTVCRVREVLRTP
jgi:hypothetical protein